MNIDKSYFSTPILSFKNDNWTVDDAMKGVSILGGTGSGKTSGSGAKLARKYLNLGWGGIILCAKTDEADLWKSYCKECNRMEDLIIFGQDATHKDGKFYGEKMVFNPIDYELKREGEGAGQTQNIANIFMNIYRMGNRISGGGEAKEERFWDVALKRCINRIIELLKLAQEDLSFKNMVKVLSSAVELDQELIYKAIDEIEGNKGEAYEEDEFYCTACLAKAYFRVRDHQMSLEEMNAFDMVYNYFTHAFNALGEKTRSTISESFMGLVEPFLSGLLYQHFSGKTNLFPEIVFTEKKIIILDFSIKEFLDIGIIAQCVFKLMFQQAVERRDVKKYPNPVFLWVDEAQYFVNSYDQIFLTTARSSRTSTVFLSQNISNYLAVMGGGSSKAKVDSLLGNLSTKIFHANMDAETNEYASRLIGQTLTAIEAGSITRNNLSFNTSTGSSYSMQIIPQVMPKEFIGLKSGGEDNDFTVEGYITVSSKTWQEDDVEQNYKRVKFKQSFSN